MKEPEPYTLPEGYYISLNAAHHPAPAGCVEYVLSPKHDIHSAVRRFKIEHGHKPKRVWFDEFKVYIPLEASC